jgi:glycosyltransferase involved in cell wall biosynthesis
VVDGGSTDGTQQIVEQVAQADSRVQLLHNPRKIQSAALNIAIEQAKGDILLRADAHADYAPDYIEQCVKTILETDALNVGGAQRFVATTPFQAGVALAAQSFFGNGGAKYRNPNYNGYAETVYLGCFKIQALRDIQGFEEEAITNQDSELNERLITYWKEQQNASTNHRAIYISSSIKVWYYPRKTWKGLFKQYVKYGRGRLRTVSEHPSAPLRARLPFLIISTGLALSILDIFLLRGKLKTKKLALVGLAIPFFEGLRVTWKNRNTFATEIWRGSQDEIPSLTQRWFWCSIALLTMPIAHFAGYAYQMFRRKILGIKGW